MSNEGLNSVKAWLTPILMSALGIMVWNYLNEMKSDLKELLTRDSATQVRIQQLEKDIDLIQKQLYFGNERIKYMKKEEETTLKQNENDK